MVCVLSAVLVLGTQGTYRQYSTAMCKKSGKNVTNLWQRPSYREISVTLFDKKHVGQQEQFLLPDKVWVL